jgi:NADH:ubiquinone reductase (H+-translocating)
VIDCLPCMKERGRLKVDEMLRVADGSGVWALGDCALVPDRKTGQFHPPTAQHAMREGKTLAKNLIATVRGGTLKPFSSLHDWPARRYRTAHRSREYPGH